MRESVVKVYNLVLQDFPQPLGPWDYRFESLQLRIVTLSSSSQQVVRLERCSDDSETMIHMVRQSYDKEKQG
jgi:hypothetical protein